MRAQSHALVLCFALFLVTGAVNLQAPLYNAYAAAGGYGVAATTVAFSCYVIGILPVLFFLGGLSDRIGRRKPILLALLLALCATVFTLLLPRLDALGVSRWLLGTATALTSATATAYMSELMADADIRRATNWVTAATSLGFGSGAALTSLALLAGDSLRPWSYWLHIALLMIGIALLWRLPDRKPQGALAPMLRLPLWPAGSLPFGLAILLAWATVGLVIAVLPSALKQHGLAHWSGFSTFTVISCGLLFQPLARKLQSRQATLLGLMILPLAYGVLLYGALTGSLPAILLGALLASSACYGFIYLGGLSGVNELAGEQKARASAGFFLCAYLGFSLPVIITGLLADRLGMELALECFGLALLLGVALLLYPMRPAARRNQILAQART